IRRRAWKIAQPRTRFIPQVRRLIPAAIPGSFYRVDKIEALVPALFEANAVEDEELELRRQQTFLGDTRISHVTDGLAGDFRGVGGLILAGVGILDVADPRQWGLRREGIDQACFGPRNNQNLPLIDRAPADDPLSIQIPPFFERLLRQGVR